MSSISVNRLAALIMAQYDADGNGEIDLAKKIPHNNNKTENTRFEPNYLTGDITEFSRGDLFKDADKSVFKDKKVTKQELESYLSKYDLDKDGVLSSRGVSGVIKGKPMGEYESFLRDYEEIELSDGVKKF